MEIVRDVFEFQRRCAALASGGGLGLVPTMGALHAGHRSLVEASRRRDASTAVTIFVNPLQFAPHEDLDRYPRREREDLDLLAAAGTAVAFLPAPGAIYPEGEATRVAVTGLERRLCGASRPGHFRGVATVVLKLLELARPQRAYFGRKDAAQVAVLRRMARDLFLPVEIVVCPIVRDADGLAWSSRNAYLTAAERQRALALVRALRAIGDAFAAGETRTRRLLAAGRAVIDAASGVRLDYLSAVDGDSLLPVAHARPGTLFAVAAFVGATRLIDNAVIAAPGTFEL